MAPARMLRAFVAALVLAPMAARADPTALWTLDSVFQNDSAVRSIVARIGFPDTAELVPLSVGAPWVGYELRVYYLWSNRMFVFMRARVGGDDVSVLRYQGPIPRSVRAGMAGAPVPLIPVPADGRSVAAEADVRAVAEAEADAAVAERAADRAEDIARRMDLEFKRSLTKN